MSAARCTSAAEVESPSLSTPCKRARPRSSPAATVLLAALCQKLLNVEFYTRRVAREVLGSTDQER